MVPETETVADDTMRAPTVGAEVNQGAVRLERADNSVIEFAKTLLRESMTRKEKPIIFGKEQLRFLTLAVKHVQQVFVGGDGEQVEQRVVMLQGQGGSGKTECLNILRAVVKRFFGSDGCVYMASSNSAARQIAGDTIHSCLHMNKNQKLTPAALDVDPNKDGASALIDKWKDVRMLVLCHFWSKWTKLRFLFFGNSDEIKHPPTEPICIANATPSQLPKPPILTWARDPPPS